MRIIVTEEFTKLFQNLPKPTQKKADKQTGLFRKNPFHSSLHTEKLNPKHKQLWSIRVDKYYRIIFRFRDDGTAVFLTIGHHNWIYKF